jgi:3-hydroxyisobutyrate dehydrogenase-like beta-hydroxyacid dehydrogenase
MADAVGRVGFVGVGRMGAAMAVRLGEAGADVVALYNRTRAKAADVATRAPDRPGVSAAALTGAASRRRPAGSPR